MGQIQVWTSDFGRLADASSAHGMLFRMLGSVVGNERLDADNSLPVAGIHLRVGKSGRIDRRAGRMAPHLLQFRMHLHRFRQDGSLSVRLAAVILQHPTATSINYYLKLIKPEGILDDWRMLIEWGGR